MLKRGAQMSERAKRILMAAGILLIASSCRRMDKIVSYTIDDELDFATDVTEAVLSASRGETGLELERIHQTIERGFLMARARLRRSSGLNYKVIPLYCKLSAAKPGADGERNRFLMKIWGFGECGAWSDMSRIWLVLETFDRQNGRYETIASSLKCLVQEHEHAWGKKNFGTSSYLCDDPQLGLGQDDGTWLRRVANGESRLYFLLNSGRSSLLNRMSRVVYDASNWERLVRAYRAHRGLVELVPFSRFDGGCFLECR